jgi:hypothetical protein
MAFLFRLAAVAGAAVAAGAAAAATGAMTAGVRRNSRGSTIA